MCLGDRLSKFCHVSLLQTQPLLSYWQKQPLILVCMHYSSAMSVTQLLLPPLAKEVMFLVALVCLSVCLSVDNITQKVMN